MDLNIHQGNNIGDYRGACFFLTGTTVAEFQYPDKYNLRPTYSLYIVYIILINHSSFIVVYAGVMSLFMPMSLMCPVRIWQIRAFPNLQLRFNPNLYKCYVYCRVGS